MRVKLAREKTGAIQTNINVFLHHHSWAVCPLHALGTMIVMNGGTCNKLFANIPKAGEAKYLNRVLKALFVCWNKDDEADPESPSDFVAYTSHAQCWTFQVMIVLYGT